MTTAAVFYVLSAVCFLLGAALIAVGATAIIRRNRPAPRPKDRFRFVMLDETILIHSDEIIPI